MLRVVRTTFDRTGFWIEPEDELKRLQSSGFQNYLFPISKRLRDPFDEADKPVEANELAVAGMEAFRESAARLGVEVVFLPDALGPSDFGFGVLIKPGTMDWLTQRTEEKRKAESNNSVWRPFISEFERQRTSEMPFSMLELIDWIKEQPDNPYTPVAEVMAGLGKGYKSIWLHVSHKLGADLRFLGFKRIQFGKAKLQRWVPADAETAQEQPKHFDRLPGAVADLVGHWERGRLLTIPALLESGNEVLAGLSGSDYAKAYRIGKVLRDLGYRSLVMGGGLPKKWVRRVWRTRIAGLEPPAVV